MLRQGDLLFVPCDGIPSDAKVVADNVVARGETTGHTHRVRAGAVVLMAGMVQYIRALQEAFVDHEEHATVILPTGDWLVKRQREYQPDGWRQVAD